MPFTVDPTITVRDLTMIYPNGTVALRGVNFDVARGEVFALLGPNGAGKTSTIEILEGFRRRSSGTATVLGLDPADASRPWRDRVGIVLQTSGTSDEVNVRELLELQAAYHANPRPLDEVLGLVGLADQATTRIDRLSGGQQRRLDVGRGIIGRPDLLFLDEPTTGFDPEARRQFWELIASLRDEGTTIVLTTHYLEEAEVLADRIGVIVGGQLVATGTPAELGGRDEAPAIVGWTEDDQRCERRSHQPAAVILELTNRLGLDIENLTVTRPTLESAYLELVAHHETTPAQGTTGARS